MVEKFKNKNANFHKAELFSCLSNYLDKFSIDMEDAKNKLGFMIFDTNHWIWFIDLVGMGNLDDQEVIKSTLKSVQTAHGAVPTLRKNAESSAV